MDGCNACQRGTTTSKKVKIHPTTYTEPTYWEADEHPFIPIIGWYSTDRIGGNRLGPFGSKEECAIAVKEYIRNVS